MRSRVKYRLTANRDFINLQHMSVKCAGRPLLTCTELMCGLMVRRRSAGSPAARTAPPSCSASSPRTSRRTMRCAAGRRRRVLRLSSPCHVLFPDAIHDLPMHTAAHTLSGLSPWLTDACPSASLVLHSAAQSCAASPHASRTADANSYSLCMFPSMTPRQAGPDHRAQTPWTGPGPVHHGPGRNAAHAGRRLHLHAAGADCAAVPGRAGRQQQLRRPAPAGPIKVGALVSGCPEQSNTLPVSSAAGCGAPCWDPTFEICPGCKSMHLNVCHMMNSMRHASVLMRCCGRQAPAASTRAGGQAAIPVSNPV